MKVITNKGFRLILFIAGFVGILFAFLASFAAVARFELFSSKVNKDSNYYISESMKNELMEGLLNQQNWAKNKSELRNIELDNHKIDIYDYNSLKTANNTNEKTDKSAQTDKSNKTNNSNTVNKKANPEQIDLVTFIKNGEEERYDTPAADVPVAEVLASFNSTNDYSYLQNIPECGSFIRLTWGDYQELIKNEAFSFNYEEYYNVSEIPVSENYGEEVYASEENIEENKAKEDNTKKDNINEAINKQAYILLNEAVENGLLSGGFTDGDYVVCDGENVFLYSPTNNYLFQNNQQYQNGGVLYTDEINDKDYIYLPYIMGEDEKNTDNKSLLTSHIFKIETEAAYASLDANERAAISQNTHGDYGYYSMSTAFSYDDKVAEDLIIMSNKFGEIPYIEVSGNKETSYKEACDKLKNISEIYISYDAASKKIEQWYKNDKSAAVPYNYLTEADLKDLTSIADVSFVASVDADGNMEVLANKYVYDICRFFPAPAFLAVIGLLVFLAAVIVLTIGEKPVIRLFDKIPVVFQFALIFIYGAFGAMVFYAIAETSLSDIIFEETVSFIAISIIYSLFVYLICAAIYLSIVRRIKCKKFLEGFIIYRIARWIKRKFFTAYGTLKGKTRVIITVAAFSVINVITVLCLCIMTDSGVSLLMALILFAADGCILYLLIKNMIETELLLSTTRRIEEGELDAQVDVSKLTYDNAELGKSVNNLGTGLSKAIESSVRDERTKAELITNVSHDIKTPLTSIINYVDLLKREDIDNPKAVEYIEVLDKKSERLKQLILDLIEASKTSTGNIELEKTNMNLVELMRQVIGEYEEKFEEKQLELIQTIPMDRVIINADGRRVFRIIDNIMNNIDKYALPGTRVYIEMKISEDNMNKDGRVGNVTISFKNVSSKMLNISPEELMERFVRGDESRTTEGSGLGLSIAKNLTQLHGGNMNLEIDGDLFKVNVTFPVVE